MTKYIFDRNEFVNYEEFYMLMQKKMNLPEWFGKNPSALWDMLTGYIEFPCKIVLVGFGKEINDKDKLQIGYILNVFREVEKQFPNEFKVEFK